MERRLFAMRTYAKAMFLLREYLRQSPDSTRRGYYHLRLQRVAHDLIGVCEDGSWKHLGFVNNKGYEEYLYNHSVNVTVLALMIGLRLNLKRPRLAELSMAALLHDVGKAQLPAHLMGKQGAFTDEERKQLDSHPELGLRSLLKVRQYNEALLKRIVVICEHHQAASEKSDHHPYSRAVAVACTFDALTSERPYRAPFRPDVAMKILHRMSDDKLDRGMVALFIQTLGLYPCGSLVELSDKSLAVAIEPHDEAKLWRRPTVRMVQDPGGMRYLNAPVVDLAEAPVRDVVRTLEPAAAGVNVGAVLFEEAPKKVDGR
jgi:HD-GYP domain-containing protein (c-di-GMP phosphodiesterase class II)